MRIDLRPIILKHFTIVAKLVSFAERNHCIMKVSILKIPFLKSKMYTKEIEQNIQKYIIIVILFYFILFLLFYSILLCYFILFYS